MTGPQQFGSDCDPNSFAHLTLPQLFYRRFVVWRIRRLTKSARRKADKIERLWASIGIEVTL